MIFDREPVLIASLVRAAIVLATAFGLGLQPEQIGALMLFTEAVLGLIVRNAVTSPATAAATLAKTAVPSEPSEPAPAGTPAGVSS